mgnify:CR=1 FL=1
MKQKIKNLAKKIIPNLEELRKSGGSVWVFRYSNIKWMFEPSLRKQLPFFYKIYSFYCKINLYFLGETSIQGTKSLFFILARLLKLFQKYEYLHLQLPNYEIYLNPYDSRFLTVVNELMSEQADTKVLLNFLSPGDTFIDIGANHGSFSVIASRFVGSTGYVLSVEPQPHLARLIEKSLKANAMCNFKVCQIALGDSEGEVELLIPKNASGSSGIFSAYSGIYKHYTIKVPVKCFDEVVDWKSFQGRVLIKLDVEGSEYLFLKGAKQAITSLKPNLIIEINFRSFEVAGVTRKDLIDLLIELDYQEYAELENPRITFPLEKLDIRRQRNILVCSQS